MTLICFTILQKSENQDDQKVNTRMRTGCVVVRMSWPNSYVNSDPSQGQLIWPFLYGAVPLLPLKLLSIHYSRIKQNVLTTVLCNKRCVRKLQFVVRTWADLNKNTIHLMALAISRFTEYQLLAAFWFLPGRPWCAGYWQAVLGRQNFLYVCLCLAHTDICATSDSSNSKRPDLAKITCPSVIWSLVTNGWKQGDFLWSHCIEVS